MNSDTGNGTSVSVPRSPEISNLSDSSNCSSDLLRFKGSLSGQAALVLIDCGSTHDFVSSSFVERSNLEAQTTNKNFSATLADGRICSQPHTVTAPVTLEQDGWSPWSPQASYDRRRHRNCFPTRKSASISEKVNISWGHRSVDAIFTCVDLHVVYYNE